MLLALVPWFFVYPDFVNLGQVVRLLRLRGLR